MAPLAEIATGRTEPFFAADLAACDDALREQIGGRRILAIGAAGSIGSSTVFTLCRYGPNAIHLVDQNENALAEFVRQFRASALSDQVADFRALPLDYGAFAMERMIAEEPPYHIVLNFAAIKHVRSEKDVFSILQMLDTNIVKQARLIRWIARHSPQSRYFSVSTDKAANPSSFMGATKRVMEHVMFDTEITSGLEGPVTSARFANVAFSNGSLLQAFENRIARREPIACPLDIRRYFVSLEEAGQICALAAIMLKPAHIAIPKLDPEENLVMLHRIAEAFIVRNGYEPCIFENEHEAKARCSDEIAKGRWPLILTKGDTVGEKPFEEFVAKGETVIDCGLSNIQAIAHRRSGAPISPQIERLERIVLGEGNTRGVDRESIKAIIAEIEPGFMVTHRDSTLHLDQRM